eukprot:TRINITY_DN4010_c1_g2_i4.p2 TRINITY_DN4010_c1_g2~~TRINITY_DN4010_c1_g2_i4.p2  ORF type:complete len:103 (-),score=32.89 TRINITY_DN4010_c1_g2_i4:504-782(-)
MGLDNATEITRLTNAGLVVSNTPTSSAPNPSSNSDTDSSKLVLVGVISGVGALVVVGAVFGVVTWYRKRQEFERAGVQMSSGVANANNGVRV